MTSAEQQPQPRAVVVSLLQMLDAFPAVIDNAVVQFFRRAVGEAMQRLPAVRDASCSSVVVVFAIALISGIEASFVRIRC